MKQGYKRYKYLFAALAFLLFFGLWFFQESDNSVDVVEPEMVQRDLLIDPSIAESLQSETNVRELVSGEAVFDPIINPTQKPLELTPFDENTEASFDEVEYKKTLNLLAEPLQAIQSVSRLYQDSIGGVLQSKEYDPEEIQTYISLLTFSAKYIKSLDSELYVQEKTIIENSLSEMSSAMQELLDNKTPEGAVLFSTSSASLNRMVVQIGQDVSAKNISIASSEPGYLFVFEL